MIYDWANDNMGSIELSGNLAAVGQRHLAIQKQMEQVAALQSLAEAHRRQQIENALLEERQNILYDISAALEDIRQALNREPGKAYFDFLILEEFVSSLGLEHRLFPSLEWKSLCNKTLAGISELKSWCNTSLDSKAKRAGESALAQCKLAEKQAQEQQIREQKAKQAAEVVENTILVEKKFAKFHQMLLIGLICGGVFVLAVCLIAGTSSDNGIAWLAAVSAFWSMVAFFAFALSFWQDVQAARKKIADAGK
jgi:hypothetical protein